MSHKGCNTDMLGVLLIYPQSPTGTACPQDCAYISVKPLAAVLPSNNVFMYVYMYCMYVCMYVYMYVCTYVRVYVCTV